MNGCDIITYILQTERKLSLEKMRFESRTPALARIPVYSLARVDARSSVRIFPKRF